MKKKSNKNEIQLHEAFLPILEHAQGNKLNYNTLVYYGGRGSGKTHNALLSILLHTMYSSDNVMVFRYIQNSIRQSSHKELQNLITKYSLDNLFEVKQQYILNKKTRARIEFRGLYLQTDAIRSLSSSYNVIILEECQQVDEVVLTSLMATILRFSNLLLIPIFNVGLYNNPAYQRFVVHKDKNTKIVMLNYYDNPFHSEAMELQRLYDKKNLPPEVYDSTWEGIPIKQLTNGIFTQESVSKLFSGIPSDTQYEYTFISYDPAVSDKNISEDDKSNSNGITVFGYTGKQLVVLELVCKIMSPQDSVNTIGNLYDKYNCSYVLYENNQGGSFIGEAIKSYNKNINVIPYRSTQNKVQRASLCIPVITNDKVKLSYDIIKSDECKILESQINRLTTGGFLANYKNESPDLLDSLVFGIIHVFNLHKSNNLHLPIYSVEKINGFKQQELVCISFDNMYNKFIYIKCEVFNDDKQNYYLDFSLIERSQIVSQDIVFIDKESFSIDKHEELQNNEHYNIIKELNDNFKIVNGISIIISSNEIEQAYCNYNPEDKASLTTILRMLFTLIHRV